MAVTSFECADCGNKFKKTQGDHREKDAKEHSMADGSFQIIVCPKCGCESLDLIPENHAE